MARLPKAALLGRIVEAVEAGGWYVAPVDRTHPFRLLIHNREQIIPVRVYIWNITHGGGTARSPNEYRIQITGLNHNQFERARHEKTLILGWWEEARVFAGFDYGKHQGPLGASPSLQINRDCLELAVADGFAPCLKTNQEIAIAFRPDFLVSYVQNLEVLHQFGTDQREFELLQQVARQSDNLLDETAIDATPPQRRSVLRTVRQRLRDSRFREKVLTAYHSRCAFCGIQLNLVQAAHIIPVAHPASIDDVQNGFGACPLHHTAYDQSLITFTDNFDVYHNQEKLAEFARNDLAGGVNMFLEQLYRQINLPADPQQQPRPDFIRTGNQIRGWDFR